MSLAYASSSLQVTGADEDNSMYGPHQSSEVSLFPEVQGYDLAHQDEMDIMQDFDPQRYKGYFFYPDDQDQNTSSTTEHGQSSNYIDKEPSTSSEPQYRPDLPALKWQHRLMKKQVKKIQERLWNSWPKDITNRDVIYRHVMNVSKWLDVHPEIVALMIQDDEDVWKVVLKRCMLDGNKPKRVQAVPRKDNNRIAMTEPIWLAKPILRHRKEYIFQRLATHWNGVTPRVVKSRIIEYADRYGKIHSPEPLLEDDEERFRLAADAIFCESAPYGHRNVGASREDILHQYSEQYGILAPGEINKIAYIPLKPTRIKAESSRYHSGEEWMDEMTLDQIAEVHAAIRKYWRDRMNDRVMTQAFLRVNHHLEGHREDLEKIKQGDEFTAFSVARATIRDIFWKVDGEARQFMGKQI